MSGLIPQNFIDNLLARTEIVDVIGKRIDLKKAGVNHKACCPFHNEKTPSFIVNPVKQFYHCFGCSANGSAISFLMEYEHLSFPEAVEELAAMAGLDVPREQGISTQPTTSPLYQVLEDCSRLFQQQLKSHPPAIDYLKRRGLSGDTAKRFGIGYAPNRWDALETQLQHCKQADLLSAGMLTKNDNGKIYDRFRDRITFPIRNRRGRIVGFGGRVMGNDEPKYLNSPETPVFHKGEELYGLYEARQANRSLTSLLVVEGYMDVIGLAHHGVNNAVATLGTATTAEHLERLYRVVNDIVFCFDGDRAGRQAAWRALKTTMPTLQDGREARFLFLPDGEDPDSLIRKLGRDGFVAQLDNALPLADFLFRELVGDGDNESIGDRTRLAEAAKPLIKTVPGEVYRTLLYQQLSERVGTTISENKQTIAPPPARIKRREPAYQVQLKPMRMAVSLALQRPAAINADDLDKYNFDDQQSGGFVLQKIVGIALGNPDISTAAMLEHFRDTSEWHYLRKLASSDIPGIDDEEDAERPRKMFLESIGQLARANSRRAQDELRERASQSGLSDELKAALRANIPYQE